MVVDDNLTQALRWSINSKGQVVGHSGIRDVVKLHAFLWENGGPMIDLNTRIPLNSPLQLVRAFDINDRGEIASLGVPPGVPPEDVEISGHAYVLIPCHENDAEGCKDRAEGIPAGAQSSPPPDAPVTQAPAARTQSRPTPNERVNSFWGRWANRYRIPGAGPRD